MKGIRREKHGKERRGGKKALENMNERTEKTIKIHSGKKRKDTRKMRFQEKGRIDIKKRHSSLAKDHRGKLELGVKNSEKWKDSSKKGKTRVGVSGVGP